jgi:hypothetical protein
VAWVHVAKIAPSLLHAFQDNDLAIDAGDWIGLDQEIVRVYMGALAGALARRGHFDAVTDQSTSTILAR